MAARYQLSEKEVIDAHKLASRRSSVVTFSVVLLLAIVCFFAFPWVAPALTVILVAAISVPFFLLISRFQLRKIYRQQRSLRDPIELTWDDERLATIQGDSKVYLRWDDIVQLKENEQFLLLYPSVAVFHIIPKKALSSDDITFIRARAAGGGT